MRSALHRLFAPMLAGACVAASPVVAHAESRGLVAVLPLDAREAKVTRATLQTLEEAVRTIAGDELQPRGYTVLTGETTLALLADNGVDYEKACEASCALDAARQIKAKLFISGSVATSEGEYVAFIRLFENESGSQLASVQIEAPTVKELRRDFAQKAPAFFAKALGGGAPVARTEVTPPRVLPPPPVAKPAPRPPSGPGTLALQLSDDYFGGSTLSVRSGAKDAVCATRMTFGSACALERVEPGNLEFSLTTQDGERLSQQLRYTGGDLDLSIVAFPNKGPTIAYTGLVLVGVGALSLLGGYAAGEGFGAALGYSLGGILSIAGLTTGCGGAILAATQDDAFAVIPLGPNDQRQPVAK